MYDAKCLAKLIITLATQNGHPISCCQLQLILYNLFVWYHRITGKVLFDDEFLLAVYGFVIKSVYDVYRGYGASPICAIYGEINIKNFSCSLVSEIERLINIPVNELVEKTQQSRCWQKYMADIKRYLPNKKFVQLPVSVNEIIN